MSKEKELIDALTKLRNTINPMIGHPENPFDEFHLNNMVKLADKYIDGKTTYYAVSDEEGEYLATGFNETDPEDVRQGILSLVEPQVEDADFILMKGMTLEELCAHHGYSIDKDTQPF